MSQDVIIIIIFKTNLNVCIILDVDKVYPFSCVHYKDCLSINPLQVKFNDKIENTMAIINCTSYSFSMYKHDIYVYVYNMSLNSKYYSAAWKLFHFFD